MLLRIVAEQENMKNYRYLMKNFAIYDEKNKEISNSDDTKANNLRPYPVPVL